MNTDPKTPERPRAAVSTTLPAGVVTFRHVAMACDWGLAIAGEAPRYAEQAAAAVFAEIDRLEGELSRFRPTSDIGRINSAPAGAAVRIGPDAFECLDLAARLNADSDGAFDVTVGALVPSRAGVAVTTGTPRSPQQTVGMRHLRIDAGARAVARLTDGVVVDLGALGKGFAVDQGCRVLREWGVSAALLNSGQSSVAAIGAPPGEPGWSAALRCPEDDTALARVTLRDGTLGGSGRKLHGAHIIDPRSAAAAAGTLGAWVFAPSAAVSDALSTAAMVLAAAELERVAQRRPEATILVYDPEAADLRLRVYGRSLRLDPPPAAPG